jgi:hypothetical protein
MGNTRRSDYRLSGVRLLQHLNIVLGQEAGYPDTPTWGYAFSYLAALYAKDDIENSFSMKALRHLELQDKTDPNYSWEFVVYALQSAKKFSSVPIPAHLDRCQEKGTRMFNWFLLRRFNKRLCNGYSAIDHFKLRIAVSIYQEKTGLILDELKTRSLQYHAFCLFLLAELIEIAPENAWLKKRFSDGVEYSMRHVLHDGTSLFIGRGQEQIFGYGALIYSFEYCHTKIRPLSEQLIHLVCKRLLSFQREDGSYPLVLRRREPETGNAHFSEDAPGGWYGYNTLYDYQPFLAYCLLKASELR